VTDDRGQTDHATKKWVAIGDWGECPAILNPASSSVNLTEMYQNSSVCIKDVEKFTYFGPLHLTSMVLLINCTLLKQTDSCLYCVG